MSDRIRKPEHYYQFPRREMLRYVPNDVRRVLEIGCGEGHFGAELKRLRSESGTSVEVTGIELVADRAAIAATRLDVVIAANIEQDALDLTPEYFDCIIFNDVLEHLVSPWNTLQQIGKFLHPGGHFVASIPNVRYWGVIKGLLIEGDWRYQGDGVLDVTHLRFFTRRSIVRMFEEAGYEIVTIDGINQMVRGWKFELLRVLSAGTLDDIKFWQFAVVARRPGL